MYFYVSKNVFLCFKKFIFTFLKIVKVYKIQYKSIYNILDNLYNFKNIFDMVQKQNISTYQIYLGFSQ